MSRPKASESGVLRTYGVAFAPDLSPDESDREALERLLEKPARRQVHSMAAVSSKHVDVTDSYALVVVDGHKVAKFGASRTQSLIVSARNTWVRERALFSDDGSAFVGTESGLAPAGGLVARDEDRFAPICERLEAVAGGDVVEQPTQAMYYALTPERRLTVDEVERIEQSADRVTGYHSPQYNVLDVDVTPVGLALYLSQSAVGQSKWKTTQRVMRSVDRLTRGTALDTGADTWSIERGSVGDLCTFRDAVKARIDAKAQEHGLEDTPADSDQVVA